MVINFTNINKLNNHVGNPVPGLREAQQCGGVKPVNGMPIFSVKVLL